MNERTPLALTEAGLAEFSAYLAKGPIVQEGPPLWLLEKDIYARPFDPTVTVRIRRFPTKYDMGMEVCTALGDKLTSALSNGGLWAGLSLMFHESTIPKKEHGWYVGARSRHIVERIPGRQQEQSHRHLVKGATINVSRFGTDARVLMERPDQQSKIEEQIMSRKADLGLASASQIIRAAHRLYFDPDKNTVKRGAKSTGAGSIMRFVEVLVQLDVNFDIPSLDSETVLSLLPSNEFGKFMSSTSIT